MNTEHIIGNIAVKAQQVNGKNDGDYTQDGLLYCGVCRTPKECEIEVFGEKRIVPCSCECVRQEEQRQKEQERAAFIRSLRNECIPDRKLQNATFANSDGSNAEKMQKLERYAAKWEQMRADNIGLLLWGNTGNGKTYAAACVANALIDKGIGVKITSIARILSAVTGVFGQERQSVFDELTRFPLLVIDDFGANRETGFALENIYTVIDERYRAQKPLIVTTNLSLQELKKPENMEQQRIYDRVLEMCIPVHFAGESKRQELAKEKLKRAAQILGGKADD